MGKGLYGYSSRESKILVLEASLKHAPSKWMNWDLISMLAPPNTVAPKHFFFKHWNQFAHPPALVLPLWAASVSIVSINLSEHWSTTTGCWSVWASLTLDGWTEGNMILQSPWSLVYLQSILISIISFYYQKKNIYMYHSTHQWIPISILVNPQMQSLCSAAVLSFFASSPGFLCRVFSEGSVRCPFLGCTGMFIAPPTTQLQREMCFSHSERPW